MNYSFPLWWLRRLQQECYMTNYILDKSVLAMSCNGNQLILTINGFMLKKKLDKLEELNQKFYALETVAAKDHEVPPAIEDNYLKSDLSEIMKNVKW